MIFSVAGHGFSCGCLRAPLILFGQETKHVKIGHVNRERAEYCFESTVSEQGTHWVLLQTRWVLRETRWVPAYTQTIGWKELTELAPRNSVSPEKLTEFGVWNRTLRNRIRPVLSGPVRDTPPYRAIPFRDSIAEGGIAPICLVFIGYRASIAEIPLLRGGYRTSTLHGLQLGNAQRRGRGYRAQLAMLRHQKPHSAQ